MDSDRDKLDALATEGVRADLDDLDLRSVADVVRLLVDGQDAALAAVHRAVPQLAEAAEQIAARLAEGGRLFYVGAGTSGRLAVLDAAECVPTFNTPPDMVVALLAGGEAAFIEAVEGAEDDAAAGAADLDAHGLSSRDAVVGIAASGRTPYAVGALHHASELGAYTVAIANNPGSTLAAAAEHAVELLTGPEVIAGSTRLGAGTAQKIALNTLSTAVMVKLGKTYGSRMIDVRATNAKLKRRALRIVCDITSAGEAQAVQALETAGGSVKTAVVMLLSRCDAATAEQRLQHAGGRVRDAVAAD
ncbi:MAG TPA: N-acetylmuramic acid 6-phosphate etherase [Gammaproteobacteria bacterium]|nr:N-acetylmuramic acid 6-phosphate etherase [Gammaproteobacteria bacterium]